MRADEIKESLEFAKILLPAIMSCKREDATLQLNVGAIYKDTLVAVQIRYEAGTDIVFIARSDSAEVRKEKLRRLIAFMDGEIEVLGTVNV